jgi:hypothetical protein
LLVLYIGVDVCSKSEGDDMATSKISSWRRHSYHFNYRSGSESGCVLAVAAAMTQFAAIVIVRLLLVIYLIVFSATPADGSWSRFSHHHHRWRGAVGLLAGEMLLTDPAVGQQLAR